MSLTAVVEMPPNDREVVQGWLRSPSIRAGLAQRARIVLLAGDGVQTGEIASQVGTSKQTVISWKNRYRSEGVSGLDDRPKPGRPQVIDEAQIVVATLQEPPPELGVRHWSSRLLAGELGLSHVTIIKVWKKWDLQPWRSQTFGQSDLSSIPSHRAQSRAGPTHTAGEDHSLTQGTRGWAALGTAPEPERQPEPEPEPEPEVEVELEVEVEVQNESEVLR